MTRITVSKPASLYSCRKYTVWSALLLLLLGACVEPQKQPGTRPNILFIMSDDHARSAISAYHQGLIETPHIDQIAKEGILFQNCFATNALCSPSRATILSGQYSHRTGARDNSYSMRMDSSIQTFPMLLQEHGYQTAIIGKWHLLNAPKGFNYASVLIDQGQYYNPDFITNGIKSRVHGYVTNLIADKAIAWLSKQRKPDQPFCLMVHNKAPHRDWLPDTADLDAFIDNLPLPTTLYDDYTGRGTAAHEQMLSIDENLHLTYDLKVNPTAKNPAGNPLIREFPRMDTGQRNRLIRFYTHQDALVDTSRMTHKEYVAWKYQRYIKDYLRCIRSVDRNVGRLLHYLKESGLLDNTLIVYTSDQGFFLGEHGWFDKRFMYEQSLGTPLLIRFPKLIKPGTVSKALALNLDFAPTFLELAGITPPKSMQGRSLVPLFDGKTPKDWQKAIYYHYYEYPGWHAVKRHFGIRTSRYKLIHFYYDIDEWELYDLEKDPREMKNVYNDPAYRSVRDSLIEVLKKVQQKYGDSYEKAKTTLENDRQLFDEHPNVY